MSSDARRCVVPRAAPRALARPAALLLALLLGLLGSTHAQKTFVTSLGGLGSVPIGATPLGWPGVSLMTLQFLNDTDPDAVCNDGTWGAAACCARAHTGGAAWSLCAVSAAAPDALCYAPQDRALAITLRRRPMPRAPTCGSCTWRAACFATTAKAAMTATRAGRTGWGARCGRRRSRSTASLTSVLPSPPGPPRTASMSNTALATSGPATSAPAPTPGASHVRVLSLSCTLSAPLLTAPPARSSPWHAHHLRGHPVARQRVRHGRHARAAAALRRLLRRRHRRDEQPGACRCPRCVLRA